MKLKSILLSAALFFGLSSTALADKGMWLLNELNEQNMERMKELGFTLTMDELYNPGNPSVASGVVIFGRGCTGITVSDQALIFTNHHCGYDAIQSQSSVDHDYLRDGFSAKTLQDELPIPDLQIRYLKEIVDVTPRIEEAVKGITDEMQRIQIIKDLSQKIAAEYTKGDFVEGKVVSYYAGNKYYVVVYNVFRDVRMVMAPPSSVGKFGGDTDNWMWTRHTGDFSVFRVYADANNQPAHYNASNKPYKPVSFAPVSLDGYREGSYAMTIGFPGSTSRYLTSWGVEDVINNENKPRIEVRGIKQAIWKEAMEADQATRIMYASKYASSSNYWKNSIGMNRGLKNLDVVARKQAEERAFEAWVQKTSTQSTYGQILPAMKEAYARSGETNRKLNYLYEALFGGTEIVRLALQAESLKELPEGYAETAKGALKDIYKDYSPVLDAKVLPAMLDVVRKNLPANELPEIYKTIDKKFKGDTKLYAEYVFKKSFVPYADRMEALLSMSAQKRNKMIDKDPAIQLAKTVLPTAQALQQKAEKDFLAIEKGKREYFAATRKMDPNRQMPSDANFTMRMSYGSVKGYAPKDGAWYNYYTTERGIFEKEDATSSEFYVQPEILELLRRKDFGNYGVNGELRVCFLSDNDITGGNSGSPVFDGRGNLIGLAFDGNWEAMSGDIEFEHELQRTISVDIRYVLFMIEKWAKNPRLIQELKIVKGKGCCSEKAGSEGCPSKGMATCPKAGKTGDVCPKAGKKGTDCKKEDKSCPSKTVATCPKTGKKGTTCPRDKKK
ncbi:dipeptidyl-peptidase 7. Serine peptidase. MEROPS family S46 [Porphyromonas circumdentaria]|uniref:Dipeptidyl-peptidase n=1 Tax=Porphyromonas circumdentaria TaxID=29524 RepID=A0A1T4M1P5_9PORP|nr:S46 family peptidase [Porphyromonas circumdentaria]MBB6275610.1 hypothetical protein [Porphyromonas circumdentaria]SJZ60841.1 dipeptidyl-peptidase 7. Serine peptidase. MEROPS family S46 [Porphyromonas circumdentaria]